MFESIFLVILATIDCKGRIEVTILLDKAKELSEANIIVMKKMNSLNIYNIPAKLNFFESLIKGIIENKEIYYNINNVIILLPTKLACDSLKAQFNLSSIKSPKLLSISDLSSLTDNNADYYERMSLVNKAIKIILSEKLSVSDNIIIITQLAEYFVDLLLQCDTHQIALSTLSESLNVHSALHSQSLNIVLQKLIKAWQQDCLVTKAKFNNNLINELANSKQNLIIAGINSTIPSIINLITSRFKQHGSYIVLYGLDQNLRSADWHNIEENHHQHSFKILLNHLNLSAAEVPFWNRKIALQDRNFLSEALKPSVSCNNWHTLDISSEKISFVECEDKRAEAIEIVSIVKNNLHESIMVVTADESLIIELILRMNMAKIDANIVRDYPLKQSNAAIWLKLCLNFFVEKFSSLSSLALLKHPYMNIDEREITEIELCLRDRSFLKNNLFDANLEINALKIMEEKAKSLNLFGSFNYILEQHLQFASTIAKLDIWSEAPELKEFIDKISSSYDAFNNISLKDYTQLFNHYLNAAYYRKPIAQEKKISIFKPIDARLHSANLIILAGLNDGVWPKRQNNDLILSKDILPSYKQMIGEEAYDFYCFASAPKVILTRSKRKDGSFLSPASWFLRTVTLFQQKIITKEEIQVAISIKPRHHQLIQPPISYRPKQLSVTQIEKLIFNPYHIYVDFILKLKPLYKLSKDLSSLDFGNFIHKALEIFHLKKIPILDAGEEALKIMQFSNKQIKLLWWPRFIRIAKWFETLDHKYEKIYLEHVGKIKLAPDFTLLAKADRVEVIGNKIKIKDYKTGKLPSIKSISNGKSVQLLLEAIIALKNGFSFQDRDGKYILDALEYIQVSGGEEPGQILAVDSNTELLEKMEKFLMMLIQEYSLEATPYHYTTKKVNNYCFYEHLARRFDD